MIKPSRKPDGYKSLLIYQKAEAVQFLCSEICGSFPRSKTAIALADQMNRSARSIKQNVVEGWKRNSTKEYYEFLGFSIGANKELEEDCDDIWKGIYSELMGLRGVMGQEARGTRGLKGVMGERSTPSAPSSPHYPLYDIEKLKFYPLDSTLPPIVQLKLRCKELDYLFHKLQSSLVDKMQAEKTVTANDRYAKASEQKKNEDDFLKEIANKYGLPKY